MLPVAPPSPGLHMLPVAPPSPEEPLTPPAPQDEDEHELMFIQPHDLDFVPEPIYPESMRRMRQRMSQLIIPWTDEMMEMMMTAIHLDMTLMMRMRTRRTRRRRRST
nr:hypothetical protein [Tanacetum cinerariifolium]